MGETSGRVKYNLLVYASICVQVGEQTTVKMFLKDLEGSAGYFVRYKHVVVHFGKMITSGEVNNTLEILELQPTLESNSKNSLILYFCNYL